MTRDEYINITVEQECNGCRSDTIDGYETWTPVEDCPVHGSRTRDFWDRLNEELETRFGVPA